MESKSLHIHTEQNVLQSIDEWYIKESEEVLAKHFYGVNSKKKTNLAKYRFLKAFDNIVSRNMPCDMEVTDNLLEAVSIYTNTSHFKLINNE